MAKDLTRMKWAFNFSVSFGSGLKHAGQGWWTNLYSNFFSDGLNKGKNLESNVMDFAPFPNLSMHFELKTEEIHSNYMMIVAN